MSPLVIDVHSAVDLRDVVHRAVQAIAEGQLVAFPTETVYNLAVSALNEDAVERLLRVKGRESAGPLTLAIKSVDDALDYVPVFSGLGQRLARRCWPGPVTLVFRDDHPDSLLKRLPPRVQQVVLPQQTVGLRVPAHPLILDVLRLIPGPLALSSANRRGCRAAVTGDEVVAELGDEVDLVLNDGRCQFAQQSSVVRVDGNKMEVIRAGVVSAETLGRLSSMLILFVCTGNTCRSPMAETICRRLLAEKLHCRDEELEDRGVVISSAGTSAGEGGGATTEAMEIMTEMGMDLGGHATQPVNDRLIKHADVIFTMTRGHRHALLARWPDAANRTYLLSPDEMDVADPIGGPRELYRRCAEQIQTAIRQRLDELTFPESSK